MFDDVWPPNMSRLSPQCNKREMFGDQLTIKHSLVTKHFTVWTPCLVLPYLVWSCLGSLIKFEFHQTFDQKLKAFLLFSYLMSDVIFVWRVAYQKGFIQACVPRLLSGLYQLFDLCFMKHVLKVLPLTTKLACICHQTMFDGVWLPNISRLPRA